MPLLQFSMFHPPALTSALLQFCNGTLGFGEGRIGCILKYTFRTLTHAQLHSEGHFDSDSFISRDIQGTKNSERLIPVMSLTEKVMPYLLLVVVVRISDFPSDSSSSASLMTFRESEEVIVYRDPDSNA
jgi:hypothetical protein